MQDKTSISVLFIAELANKAMPPLCAHKFWSLINFKAGEL
jgi:hypothetical protein